MRLGWFALLLSLTWPALAEEPPRRAAWDASAAFEQALRLDLGLGVPADGAAAAVQLCRAAAMGSQAAALHLAVTRLMPELSGYSPAEAAAWLRFAQTRARLGADIRIRPPPCPGSSEGPDGRAPLAELVTAMALERGLDPALVKAMIAVESAWRADAVSSAGAQGLMQLMPATSRHLGVANAFDVEENLRGGMDHLAALLRRFGGDETLALAAYNAGEGRVAACRCVPAIAETTAYVRRVLTLAAGPSVPRPQVRAAPASRASSGATARGSSPPE